MAAIFVSLQRTIDEFAIPSHPSSAPLYILLLLALPTVQGCAARTGLSAPDKEGILLAAFGTSQPAASAAFAKIEARYREAFPDTSLEWAFTSPVIRDKLTGDCAWRQHERGGRKRGHGGHLYPSYAFR